ncbi:MAG: hypothetical protein HWD63_05025 [Candidatus Parvibacillus calidus]|nr:MAG: hypothetical protein HWD63_05025 [Candidatus Parvibacillus calidus]
MNIGSSFNAGDGILDVSGIPTGLGYTFKYTVKSPLGLCPDDKATITVDRNELPNADAGVDGFIDCVTTAVDLGVAVRRAGRSTVMSGRILRQGVRLERQRC